MSEKANATRRIKLQFDKNGELVLPSTLKPECFKVDDQAVLPPHDVIPIIFVHGVCGSNLTTDGENTWTVPNSALKDVGNILSTSNRSQEERQNLFDPLRAEVNWNGACSIPDSLRWLTTQEAKRRGWGAIHAGSYHQFLIKLEQILNDMTTDPGVMDIKKNFLLPEIGMMEYLDGGLLTTLTCGESDPRRDYGAKAEDAISGWKKNPQALRGKEISKLASYYYPVWVFGYNWLQDNEISADELLKYIVKIITQYKQSAYFNCADKVILVTHSMGGLVARRAAQKDASNILGVVHGAQPVMGAPALYRRIRAGQEAGVGPKEIEDIFSLKMWGETLSDAGTSAFMGWTEQSMTVQLARAPGPLELAPTKEYPMNWLVCSWADDKTIFSLPKQDPYAEIYSKTTDERWWGMVNPAYIDPSGEIRKKGDDPAEEYQKAIGKAEDFHDKLGLYAHPETYGFYGNDNDKYQSFGKAIWHIKGGGTIFSGNVISRHHVKDVEAVKNAEAIKYGTGEVTILLYYKNEALKNAFASKQIDDKPHEFKAVLKRMRNQAGDGTVPVDSGKVLERLEPTPTETFAFPSFDHQGTYNNEYAQQAAIYFIARIVQKAPPPTPRKKAMPSC